jgi:cob(I)alamin adenosyltransferase
VLDEALNAVRLKLITAAELLPLVRPASGSSKPELVLTGRGLPATLARVADLITEFRATQHYYEQGIPARKGIEY